MAAEDRQTPVWRVVLGIVFAIIVTVRLILTCSDSNRPRSDNAPDVFMKNLHEQALQQQDVREKAQEYKSNNILYLKYAALDSMPQNEKASYKIIKLRKDTLIPVEMGSKMKISKGDFFQKNYDDSLKIAIKTPDGLTIFIHDFDGKATAAQNLKSIKRGGGLRNFKMDQEVGSAKAMTYSITKNNRQFSGYALAFQKEGYNLIFEFESETLKPIELKLKGLVYLSESVKHNKK